MKWQPSKANSHKLPFKSPLLAIALTTCLIGTGIFLSANASLIKKIFVSEPPKKVSQAVDDIAAEISVKILDQEFLGSGFIVQNKNGAYAIVTNQHVLRAGEAPYSVQTPDGKIHRAEVVASSINTEYEYDLAVLKFQADANYSVAKMGSSLFLEVGEPVFAAGFPYSNAAIQTSKATVENNSKTNSTGYGLPGLTLKTGRVAIILNQALVEGYQIGYTNDVKKGMSGGALLNSRGEVVGVNGKHAYPLWESPELYQDGSQPCPALEKLITRSSLAIPIEKSMELNPQLEPLRPTSSVEVSRQSNLIKEDAKLVGKMQAKAEEATQSCDNYGTEVLGDSLGEEDNIDPTTQDTNY